MKECELDQKNFIKSEQIQQEFKDYKKFAYKKNFFVMALALILATQTQKFARSLLRAHAPFLYSLHLPSGTPEISSYLYSKQ